MIVRPVWDPYYPTSSHNWNIELEWDKIGKDFVSNRISTNALVRECIAHPEIMSATLIYLLDEMAKLERWRQQR